MIAENQSSHSYYYWPGVRGGPRDFHVGFLMQEMGRSTFLMDAPLSHNELCSSVDSLVRFVVGAVPVGAGRLSRSSGSGWEAPWLCSHS